VTAKKEDIDEATDDCVGCRWGVVCGSRRLGRSEYIAYAPASAIGSGSTATAPAANTGAVATQAANPTVVAAPAAPPIPGNANGCVGFAVSTTAHQTQQMFGQGFGAYAKSLGQNPGKAIQAYATSACGKH
jgi:hypothetical protein